MLVMRHVLDCVLAAVALLLTLFIVYWLFARIVGGIEAVMLVPSLESPDRWTDYRRDAQVQVLASVLGLCVVLPMLKGFWSRFGRWLRR